LALLLLLGYGAYIEPFWLDTTYTTLPALSFAPGSPPLKIVLFSDLHMERWGRREDEAIATIRKLEPDLLLVSGDLINVDHYQPETYADIHRFFMNLQARYGVYAVGGSVDDIAETRAALQGTPVHFLNNEIAQLEINGNKIEILGIPSHYRDDGQMLEDLSAELNPDAYKILLYHTPDLAKEKSLANINLYLAGHTHGGQIALPFVGAIFTASRYGTEYAAGLYKLANPGNTRLYVTRGLGFEGMNTPRIRLFARPEISVLTLVPPNRL
jgi:predicted MPP superfamily phosphohydrolase